MSLAGGRMMHGRRRLLTYASLGIALADISAALGATPPRLVLVHGRSQQGLNPEDLKSQWLQALGEGARAAGRKLPDHLDVAFPYYGDKLDYFARQDDIPLTSDIQTRGARANDDFLTFQAAAADELRKKAGVSDSEVNAEYGANPKAKGPLNWEWVQAMLRAIDKHAGGMSQAAIEEFLRDVFLYTTRAGVRDAIDDIVAGSLTDKPTIVVGHSLGSVVAYNILRTDRRALQVPLYVSVGCPLGIRAVRDQLRPLKFPPPVTAWYNAFDSRDVVALFPLDQANFPVTPAVENYGMVKNHTDNRHGIAGYLDDPTVASRLVQGLAG
jgi:hypothetical protein